ncbi:hypothetical protein EPN95_00255 [Patescibacteria group bacterium]|nr:MAG: hypothetical protein EPN95_00255 [Patescibacteria group bacterium]
MRIDKKVNKKPVKKILLIVVVILVFAAAYLITAHAATLWPFRANPVASTVKSTPSSTASGSQSATVGAKATDTANSSSTGTTTKNSSTDGSSSSPISSDVSIISSGQNGDTLSVRTLIADIESSGTCTLTLSKGSTRVTNIPSVGIQAGPSSSTCQGFDVSISQYGITSGTWTIVIDVTSGSTTNSTTGTVVIQ